MALHVSEIILLTVALPILKEKLRDCCEFPVAKNRNVMASLSGADIAFRKRVSLFSINAVPVIRNDQIDRVTF